MIFLRRFGWQNEVAEKLWKTAWNPAECCLAGRDGDGAQAVLPRVPEDCPHEAAVREADCQP